MHDPMTQAFVIPYGWRTETLNNGKTFRYKRPLITIWHVDPQREGTDDSCGWSSPRLAPWQRDIVKILADNESREPWFQAPLDKTNVDPVWAETLLRGVFVLLSRCFRNRGHRRLALSFEECSRLACEMVHNPHDNFRSSLCFLAGWHSNNAEDTPHNRQYHAERLFYAVMRISLRERRRWYQHPRWHWWHWKIQIEPLKTLKRWAFSRCCKCGKGFAWGYAPTTHQFDGTGPLWFRSEEAIFHSECDRVPGNQSSKG